MIACPLVVSYPSRMNEPHRNLRSSHATRQSRNPDCRRRHHRPHHRPGAGESRPRRHRDHREGAGAGTARLRAKQRGAPRRDLLCPRQPEGQVVPERQPPDACLVLGELYLRATANGARVEIIDAKQLAAIEPNARTVEKAIFSHDTAVVDPKAVLASLKEELEQSGRAKILFDCRLTGLKGSGTALTSRGEVGFSRLVNAAGAWCDKVAGLFGIGGRYRLIPFKGIYRQLRQDAPYTVNGNIYPVPDIRNPFLGVHFTRSVHGQVYLGPTAIPAFGRENYGVLAGIDAEGFGILLEDLVMFLANPQFRSVALTEPRKYIPSVFYRDAARLVKELSPTDVEPSGKVGIRPQLVDWKTKQLVMDFLVVPAGPTLHVLNPISPAFTSSMDLAKGIVAEHFPH